MRRFLAALIVFPFLCSEGAAQAIEDNFNRHDSPNLGQGWVTVKGNFGIDSMMAKSENPTQQGVTVHSSHYGPYDEGSQRLFFFSGCKSISLIAGYFRPTDLGVEARILDTDADGLFDRIEFHDQPDSGIWDGVPVSFDLLVPASAGILSIWFEDEGDRFVASVRPFGQSEEQIAVSGVTSLPRPPTNGYHAVGASGVGSFDNWTGFQDPFSFHNLVAGARATITARQLPPGSECELFVSLTGWGRAWRYGQRSELASPLYSLGRATADTRMSAAYSAVVPPQLAGLPIYVQVFSHTDGVWLDSARSATVL